MSLEHLGANNFTCLAQLIMFLTIRNKYVYVKTKMRAFGGTGFIWWQQMTFIKLIFARS